MNITKAREDTAALLAVWGETLTVKRRSVTYPGSDGKATVEWVEVTAFTGDWQPITGSAIVEEQGLEIKSDAQVVAEYDIDVEAGDRIYKADGTYEYVNYVNTYEDHTMIRLVKTQGD